MPRWKVLLCYVIVSIKPYPSMKSEQDILNQNVPMY